MLLLVALVAGAVIDRVVAARTEERLEAEAGQYIEGEVEVTIAGFPFLTQAWRSELTEVRVTGEDISVADLRLVDAHLLARGVRFDDEPAVADRVELNAILVPQTISGEITSQLDLVGVELVTTTSGIALGGEVLGQRVEIELVPQAAGRYIELSLGDVRLAGFQVPLGQLPGGLGESLGTLRIELHQLPEGLEITRISSEPEGLRIRLEGRDVVLELPEEG